MIGTAMSVVKRLVIINKNNDVIWLKFCTGMSCRMHHSSVFGRPSIDLQDLILKGIVYGEITVRGHKEIVYVIVKNQIYFIY